MESVLLILLSVYYIFYCFYFLRDFNTLDICWNLPLREHESCLAVGEKGLINLLTKPGGWGWGVQRVTCGFAPGLIENQI